MYYFKDGAVNWAQGLGFVSRFTPGNPTFDYKSYAVYPPVFPIIYALHLKIFGVSLASNQLFNSVVGVVLGWLGFFALRPALGVAHAGVAAGSAVLVLSVYCAFSQPDLDRADALAVCMGLTAMLVARSRPSNVGAAAAGAICGVILFTSPYVGVWTGVTLSVVAGAQAYRSGGLPALAARAVSGLAGGIVAMGAVLLLISLLLPGWFAGISGLFQGSSTHSEGSYFLALVHGDVRKWGEGLTHSSSYRDIAKLVLAAGLLGLAIAVDGTRHGRTRGKAWLWIAALAALSPLCVLLAPYEGAYPRLTAMMLLAGAVSLLPVIEPSSRRTYALAAIAGFGLVNVVSLAEWTRVYALRATTRASLARSERYIEDHRPQLLAQAARMAVSPQSYMLWRQEGFRPVSTQYPGFSDPDAQASLTALDMAYRGSHDARHPQIPEGFRPEYFSLYHEPRLPQVPRLFGVKLANSSYTWESAIYVRRRQ
jgi:hypothetical protein